MAAETKFRFRPWSNILPSKPPDAKLQSSIQLEDFVTASSRAVLFRKPTPQRSFSALTYSPSTKGCSLTVLNSSRCGGGHDLRLHAALAARAAREDGVRALRDLAKAALPTYGLRALSAQEIGVEEAETAAIAASQSGGLGVWEAADDIEPPPPRGWLLGRTFCREYLSSLLGPGAGGKTALRYAQLLSCACGRSLTGEHVHQRCRVLIVSLEDDAAELRRRVLAVLLHHKVEREELRGFLFLSAPGGKAGKIMTADRGRTVRGTLADELEREIMEKKIDIVALDPFVKSHGVEENANNLIDEVVQVLTDLAAKHKIAVDTPHHVSKGALDPGDADKSRGASSMVNAARLVYTLTPMNSEEAEQFSISEEDRKQYIRVDPAKVNLAKSKSAGSTQWFKLVGVRLENASPMYPNGDEVQTIEPWTPPDTWSDLSTDLINRILLNISNGLQDGNRYTDAARAGDREAWRVVLRHAPHKTAPQAREIIRTWVKNALLVPFEYENPTTRKRVRGLSVDWTKKPS